MTDQIQIGRRRVRLTHSERVLFPRDGVTKRALGDYYVAIRPMDDRPDVCKRAHGAAPTDARFGNDDLCGVHRSGFVCETRGRFGRFLRNQACCGLSAATTGRKIVQAQRAAGAPECVGLRGYAASEAIELLLSLIHI